MQISSTSAIRLQSILRALTGNIVIHGGEIFGGFDALPYYREAPAVSEEYPYYLFTGVREDAFFQTGQRQVKDAMKEGHIRVPRGWWYPEMRDTAELSGAFICSDVVLSPGRS